MSYLIPAPYTGISSRYAHINHRNPPSTEPGTDYYMPTGTPLAAPARCTVVEVGGSIYPATGRFITLDDGTRWIRYLHLLDWRAKRGDVLEAGEICAISGASGYGSELFGEPSRNARFWNNTGGDHVHVTAFRGRGYTFGASGTVDFHALTGGQVAGGGSIPFDPTGDDDMQADERNWLFELYQQLLPGKVGVKTQGAVHKVFTDTLAATNATRSAIAAHAAEWQQGEAGVRNAGRLYVLLAKASAAAVADVDEDALANELAPLLAPLLGDNISALSDEDVARLAKAVNDETRRRLAE